MSTARKHILVVDDEPQITRQIRLNLELGGEYVVREENEAGHALAAAVESHTDLVLLDVMMPGRDGGELASQFRANSKFRNIPIVFLTAAVTAEEVKKHGGYIGGERFLAKPVDPAELSQCLREELEKHAPHPVPRRAEDDSSPHLAY
jgi:DNA-binding response OmpR family regulator